MDEDNEMRFLRDENQKLKRDLRLIYEWIESDLQLKPIYMTWLLEKESQYDSKKINNE